MDVGSDPRSTESMRSSVPPLSRASTVQSPRLLPEASVCPDLLVVVQSEWNGWQKAMAPLSALEEVHWHQPAGAPRPLIHAYTTCHALVSGSVPHDCAGAGQPHRLLVCVLKSHTAPVAFQHLVARATGQPPLR